MGSKFKNWRDRHRVKSKSKRKYIRLHPKENAGENVYIPKVYSIGEPLNEMLKQSAREMPF